MKSNFKDFIVQDDTSLYSLLETLRNEDIDHDEATVFYNMICDESGRIRTKLSDALASDSVDIKMLTNINKYYDTVINILIKKIQDEQV